ncbi:MAG: GIY-YIG nuclease family protein [Myxococcota bacterium]
MTPALAKDVPLSAGTYVLILQVSSSRRARIGALGSIDLAPGFYAYVGSARGPGGLAARVAHHRRRSASPHWHIDYLRRHASLREVWLTASRSHLEHCWAQALASASHTRIPLERFGASDCSCASHLFRLHARHHLSRFRSRLLDASLSASGGSREIVRWVAG